MDGLTDWFLNSGPDFNPVKFVQSQFDNLHSTISRLINTSHLKSVRVWAAVVRDKRVLAFHPKHRSFKSPNQDHFQRLQNREMSLFLSEMWASPNVSAHRMSRRLFLAALGKNRGVSSGLTQASALVWEALLFWSFDWNLESAGNAKTPGWDDVRWRDWIAGADSWARPHERPADGGLFWCRSRDTPASKT